MKFSPIRKSLLGALLALGGVGAGQAQPPQTLPVLTVHADRSGAALSPHFYGIFFEEINHAGDGGIYAELVRNRSFEDGATPEAWSCVIRDGAAGSIAVDVSRPLNASQRQSLRIDFHGQDPGEVGSGQVGAGNGGYWGVPLRKGGEYRLTCFARRSDAFRGSVIATLEAADGRVYARKRLTAPGKDWSRLATVLRSEADDPAARLVLSVDRPGTVWLDMVSLLPRDTWKQRGNGLRRDLAELVAGMKPAFLRFPGGCFVEGACIANAYRWKSTLGPIETRSGHLNDKWGYTSTDGLGYHEYLQWCEDLGAEPLFVANCGMACQFSTNEHVPLTQLDDWIQDALDAVEYANGPVTSRWGAQRARNGHPKPFGMKYLEIGNENGWGATLPAYEARYARFYDALKRQYPELKLIATTPVRSRPMDLVDDHYYNRPEWFVANANRYDTYDRKGPKVYVGEYAVTQNCGLGNVRAAVAEAAFMTGLERNADVITMASYAPLLVNVKDRKWNPDAICFDTTRSYGTPSYWVQRMFAENRPDRLLDLELPETRQPVIEPGGVGLSTWLTRAEFRNVRVTRGGETLLGSDAGLKGPEPTGWKVLRGDWEQRDGLLRQTNPGEDMRATAGDPRWTDYTYSLQARKLSGEEGFLVMFRVRDERNFYWWNLGGWLNTKHAIEKSSGGAKTVLGNEVPARIETGKWYDIKIEVQGPRIRCYLDGKLIHAVEDRGGPELAAVAGRRGEEIIVKVVNASDKARTLQLDLRGAGALYSKAEAWVLTGQPEEENSLDQPERVRPRLVVVPRTGESFPHAFPAHSVTILRLREQKRR